jgi:hypothetical protein
MPNIINATELRKVLGVSVSLYDDAYLTEIITTAELVLLPKLVSHTSGVDTYRLVDNVARLTTLRRHYFEVGQSVIVAGLPSPLAGTKTITKRGEFWFEYSATGTDVTSRAIIPAAKATLSGYSAYDIYNGNAAVESALYAICTDIFQSRKAAGGQIESIDGTISPYRMGGNVLRRVLGLVSDYWDVENMVD